MKLCRSALYVPGHRAGWIEKAASYGADRLILDLEDAVPPQEKSAARAITRAGLERLSSLGQAVTVRVNSLTSGLIESDLETVVCGELDEVALPKIETAADLEALDELLTGLESRLGLPVGQIGTPLECETAQAMRNIYEIVTRCPRVRRVSLAAGPGGDAARSVGYQWTPEGTETLYLRSKAVLDSRAAGIEYPMVSSWWNIKDLEGLGRDARLNRRLGFRGQTVMHPSHVPIVNRVFTPTAEELAFYEGLVRAMEAARAQGSAAVVYEGNMVDEAMLKTAREMLEFARSLPAKSDDAK